MADNSKLMAEISQLRDKIIDEIVEKEKIMNEANDLYIAEKENKQQLQNELIELNTLWQYYKNRDVSNNRY